MAKESLYDTIAAISTPIGEGGISVIRLSGSGAFGIIRKIFFRDRNKSDKINTDKIQSHTIHFGYVFNGNELTDEVLISVFKKPNSYTGEDVVELSSHGGILVTQKILGIILANGARHAEPGEFTKRAYLNGKIDLSQAEAVSDLIKAKTDEAHQSSVEQLEGSLSDFVRKIRQELIDITSLVELELDFAEEDVEFAHKDKLKEKALTLAEELKEIVSSYIKGKIIRDGVNVVIAGNPNSGKSSLFNFLLKSDRAIVSSISGTTRDYLEETLISEGILFNMTDTAGLRITEDEIETEGIRRSYKKINKADLVLYLIDSSEEEKYIKDNINYYRSHLDKSKTIPVFTKSDISVSGFNRIRKGFKEAETVTIMHPESVEGLKKKMAEKVRTGSIDRGSKKIILTNLRHKLCLENVIRSLEHVAETIDKGMSGEFLSVDLRNAMNYLGEITGEITNDDILHNIFSKFCIGK